MVENYRRGAGGEKQSVHASTSQHERGGGISNSHTSPSVLSLVEGGDFFSQPPERRVKSS